MNQEILKAFKNNRNSLESFSTNIPVIGGFVEGILQVAFSTVFFKVISEKKLCSKGFTSNLRDIFS